MLKVISARPANWSRCSNAMLENATRICEAKFGNYVCRDGDAFRTVALHGAPPAYVEESAARTANSPAPRDSARRA